MGVGTADDCDCRCVFELHPADGYHGHICVVGGRKIGERDMRTLKDVIHENHELMRDISRLEDKNERLERLNRDLEKMATKYQQTSNILDEENHHLRVALDSSRDVIEDLCTRVNEQDALLINQREVIKELEKRK